MALPPSGGHAPQGYGTVASCLHLRGFAGGLFWNCGILLKTNDLPRAFGRGVGWVSAGWPGSGMDVSESKPGTVYAFGIESTSAEEGLGWNDRRERVAGSQ